MLLWNDYEGKTIAGEYTLGPLLWPEGRSAFFALSEGADGPATLGLTESLNDEDLMLGCWKRLAGVKQENLLRMKTFGKTEVEGTPLTYVVLEGTDANLADLLKERPLTHEEGLQVASALVAALGALHAEGLVHGRVEPAFVMAVGETVKLRTDCIRECVDKGQMTAAEWQEKVQKDVHDLALLLLRGVTLAKTLTPGMRLVAPFDRVIPNGVNGTWGLAEIAAAVAPKVAKQVVAAEDAAKVGPVAAVRPAVAPLGPQPRPQPAVAAVRAPVEVRESVVGARGSGPLLVRRIENEPVPVRRNWVVWGWGAGAAVFLLFLLLHGFRSKPAREPVAVAPVAAPVAAAPVVEAPAPVKGPATQRAAVGSHMQAGWYVIAYTYNREDQAWKRVAAIMRRHPTLQPGVLAPNGRAPFLVAIGGAMSRDEAELVRNRARRQGLPRDTFVRNYVGG